MKAFKFLMMAFAISVMVSGCNSQSKENAVATTDEKSEMPYVSESGIGELEIGTSLTECLIAKDCSWIPTKEEIETNDEEKFGFYNKMGIKQMVLGDGRPYITLYKDNELMAALECSALLDNGIYSTNVDRIIAYSPKLKMANGIHTGMSAKELVEKFGAEIQYSEGADAEILSFKIADTPSNIILIASAMSINREKIDSQSGNTDTEFYLQLDDVEDCKLSAIVIEQNQDSYGTY